MIKNVCSTAPTLALLLLAACGQASSPDAASLQTAKTFIALKADEVHWNADWKSGDAAKIAAHFGDKAKLMIPDAPAADGAAAIKATVQQALDTPGFSFTFSSDKINIAKSGDMAVARGVYTETAIDPATRQSNSQTGSFVSVYKTQSDGRLKVQWYITTPGPAPTKPSAP